MWLHFSTENSKGGAFRWQINRIRIRDRHRARAQEPMLRQAAALSSSKRDNRRPNRRITRATSLVDRLARALRAHRSRTTRREALSRAALNRAAGHSKAIRADRIAKRDFCVARFFSSNQKAHDAVGDRVMRFLYLAPCVTSLHRGPLPLLYLKSSLAAFAANGSARTARDLFGLCEGAH